MSSITIVGGGVAGLTLAATLDPARYDVTVVERSAHAEGRVPTAFGIWAFALEALERIGVAADIRDRGLLLTSGVVTADSAHRPVAITRRNPDLRLITRPSLLQLLDNAVPPSVRREHRSVHDVTALRGDLVVAADGARSVVRSQVWGDSPRDTGVLAIRGVLERPPAGPAGRMYEFWGEARLFGFGPNPMDGGVGTNWYASARRGEESAASALAWARRAFDRFPEAVRATLAAADPEHTLVNSILESRRPTGLVRSRYVLIGDAAHAMSPNLGRGACEAMVDAVVLGELLNAHGARGTALYDKARFRAGQRTRRASSVVRQLALSTRLSRHVIAGAALVTR